MNYIKPQFIIKYDHIIQSINAYFSFHDAENIKPYEQEAMNIIAEKFNEIAVKYVNGVVSKATLRALSDEISSLLYSVCQQTGVEFILNDDSIRDFEDKKRYSLYDITGN